MARACGSVDVSDARSLRQVGFYRVTGTGADYPSSNSWDVGWYNDDSRRVRSSRRGGRKV